MSVSVNNVTSYIILVENNNGDIHLESRSGSEIDEMYFDLLDNGSYDYYYKDGGTWYKNNVPVEQLSMMFSIFAEMVYPWSYADFTYDAGTHSYYCASKEATFTDYRGNAYIALMENIYLKFQDGKLVSMKYDTSVMGQTSHSELSASKWGTTSFTYLEVGGGEPPIVDIPVTDITLDKQTIELKVDQTAVINASVLPENATNKKVVFTCEDSNILEVVNTSDSSAIMQAKAVGKTRVIASSGEFTAYCSVVVSEGSTVVAEKELYKFSFTGDWDITSDDAVFKVWIWGGSYGEGQWIDAGEVYFDEILNHWVIEVEALNDCDGFIIVRCKPSINEVEDINLVDVWKDYKWNQSGDLVPVPFGEESNYINFGF